MTISWIAVCAAPLHILVFYSKMKLTKLVTMFLEFLEVSSVYNLYLTSEMFEGVSNKA